MQWDPTQYLRYTDERLRPALDLMARVPLDAPSRIVDLGCGPGNVTAILAQRWPSAAVIGLDGSAAMLDKARAAAPACTFIEGSFGTWAPAGKVDLLYSNAALHWLGGHPALFPRLLGHLAPGGVFAVQMPAMHDAPLRALQHEVAANGPWAERLIDVDAAPAILAPGAYYDILRPHLASLDIWQTTYLHVLPGEDAVVQWASGTSLKPFLDKLDGRMRAAFLKAYADAVRPEYPRRADGMTLLPFQRLFLLGRVAG
jgi:trans-aconitate 2-methyltransferase